MRIHVSSITAPEYAGFAAALLAANPELAPGQIACFVAATEALLAATDLPTLEEAKELGPIKLAETTITKPRKVRVYWRRRRSLPRWAVPVVTARPITRSRVRARRRRTAGRPPSASRDRPDGDPDPEPRPLAAS